MKKGIELDMNPMVDLAFLLLTFFMLATTFSKPQVMELVMPVTPDREAAEQVQAVRESQALTVILAKNDQVFWFRGITEPIVQRAVFSQAIAGQFLRGLQETVSEPMVLIKLESNARYENLIDLLDEINAIGIGRYAITDLTESDQELILHYSDP